MTTDVRAGQIWQCRNQQVLARIHTVQGSRFQVTWLLCGNIYRRDDHGVDDRWITATPNAAGYYENHHGSHYALANLLWDPTDANVA